MASNAAPSRRAFVTGLGAAAVTTGLARAQTPSAATAAPPTVITNPPRQWDTSAPPEIYPDPDIVVIDGVSTHYLVGLSAIHRVEDRLPVGRGAGLECRRAIRRVQRHQGQHPVSLYLGDRRGHAVPQSVLQQQRQQLRFPGAPDLLQGFFRRVVRWELDGSMKVIADSFDGKLLNSPNDLVPHPDGSIWFTDPPYGTSFRRAPDVTGGPAIRTASIPPSADIGGGHRRMKREAPVALSLGSEQPARCRGARGPGCRPERHLLLARLQDAVPDQHRPRAGRRHAAARAPSSPSTCKAQSRQWRFHRLMVDGVHCGPDGMRADGLGNFWCSSNAPLGYSGVLVLQPAGKLIGRIRLPEVCANLFAGPKRDSCSCARASRSTWCTSTQGAAPG